MSALRADLLEDAIRLACFTIAADYDASLHGKRQGGRGDFTTGSKEPPPPVPLHTIDVRAECCDRLAGWALMIAETKDLHPRINVRDAPLLARFVEKWAQWLSTHEAGGLCEAELTDSAQKITRLASPERRDYLVIGVCPVSVAVDGSPAPCGGQVRAYTERNLIQCRRCGTEDTLAWWESQIVPNLEAKALLTGSEVCIVVHRQTTQVVAESTVRQWAVRGFVQRHGKDTKGRTLYSWLAVVMYVQSGQREVAA